MPSPERRFASDVRATFDPALPDRLEQQPGDLWATWSAIPELANDASKVGVRQPTNLVERNVQAAPTCAASA